MAPEPEETSVYATERYEPGDGGPIIAYEHIHRYVACAAVVEGRTVLDVASGAGYGAALLARTAARVVGVDIDPDAVEAARARYGPDGPEFRQADMFALPFDDGAFEVVTCFEAIEHVATPGRALDELARVVAPDGTLIISTPDKAVYSDAADYHNEFHLHEFYRDEFEAELKLRFSSVTLLGQRIRAGSELVALDPPPSSTPGVQYLPDLADPSRAEVSPPVYLVAVCHNGERRPNAPQVAASVLLDGSDRLIDEYIVAAQAAWSATGGQNDTIAELAAQLAQRDAQVVDLNVELVGARAYAVEMSRQYELAVAKHQAVSDELLRVARESEQRAVHLLSAEELLSNLRSASDQPA